MEIKDKKAKEEEIIQKLKQNFMGKKRISGIEVNKKYITHKDSTRKIYFCSLNNSKNIKIRASILYIHGLGEHSNRNMSLFLKFLKKGYNVYMIDLSGFGFSSGSRSMSTQRHLFEDLTLALFNIKRDKPLFLVGHSMGGGVLLSFLRLNMNLNIVGVICSNPFIDFHKNQNIFFFEKFLISNLPKKVMGLSYNPPVDPFDLSNNPKIIQDLFTDPLIIRHFPARTFKTLCELNNILKSKVNHRIFNYPLLIFSGEKDPLTSFRHARWFFNFIKCKDKTLKLVKGGKHEVFHDYGNEEVWDILFRWMDQRMENKKIKNFYMNKEIIFNLKSKKNKNFLVTIGILFLLYVLFKKRKIFKIIFDLLFKVKGSGRKSINKFI